MFTSYILKLTGYCNLNCSYCYMFNSEDRSFSRKPTEMTREIALTTVARIGEHARARGLSEVAIALHGGEPTLWSTEYFAALLRAVESLRRDGLKVELALQTNMLKLPRADLLDLLEAAGVQFGISLDGPKAVNDAARVDFAGRGSYDRIMRNVGTLIGQGRSGMIGGFLCVMQPEMSPRAFLDWLVGMPITRATLLWPLEPNQANPPWQDRTAYAASPPIGVWLARLYEEWLALDRLDVEIRFFDETMQALLGAPPQRDDIGAWSFNSLVVNTDGAIELTDYLRTSADAAGETGFNVVDHSFDMVASSFFYRSRRMAAEAQPGGCSDCAYWEACRGGTLAGRLDADGMIGDQPSVLCDDHRYFYDHVAQRLMAAQHAA